MLRFNHRVQLLAGVAAFIPAVASAQTTSAPTTDPNVVPAPVATPAGRRSVYTAADFARFAPKSAYDMLVQVPGFTIRVPSGEVERGLGQAKRR